MEYFVIGKGHQTIVIEIGIGNSFYNWFPFIDQIKGDYKIVIYHRAGYGNSRESAKSRTAVNIAEELNELIEELDIEEKFLLLGHSFGGLCAQQYAKMYPKKLIGVILVDATSPNFQRLYDLHLPVMYTMISLDKIIESNIESSQKATKELSDTFSEMVKEYKNFLSEKDGENFREFISNPLLFRTVANEFSNWAKSSQLIKESGEFPNIPLTVIARDKEFAATPYIEHGIPSSEATLHEEVWRELQIELAGLSSKGKLVIAEDSDHEIHRDRPDILIQSIEEMLYK
ncbi:alpha/beta fold hydrolase [Virgibacillus flavescens]|uniref:alpha/beta fold hydrolase n=1 Tax=Virgibacillus flavescens TaxID=1611422 RepID=UPI003D3332F2